MTETPRSLRLAFVLSGVAGLVYEVLWSRYLALYVGRSAYAQVLVLAVYLSGMAVGSIVLADRSRRVARPLLWYAAAEGLLAVFGLLFDPIFRAVTGASYDSIFPALGGAGAVSAVRWGIAGSLILPQAMVLGATFPLMAASLVRMDEKWPGRAVARVYLLITLGGAAGVLLAGFVLIAAFGLPGTAVAAAVLHLGAAGLALRFARRSVASQAGGRPTALPEPPDLDGGAALSWSTPPRGLALVLLSVSLLTALASFTYEISWTRMLSLALGSATHSFELMLSAFILGLAIGAWWIRDRADRTHDPVRLLGLIQVSMGLAALASLPLFYFVAFDVVAWMVPTLSGTSGGYTLFNLARYGLSLVVMLPATILAGMTLPLITGTLLRAGSGEATIGRVYGINTIGSVVGAGLAGLVVLPWLGLKGLLIVGAALDVMLGLLLLERSARWSSGRLRLLGAAAVACAALFAAVGLGLRLDQVVMGSGVYRRGELPEPGDRIALYYADGRTATVSAYAGTEDGVIVLATNGKPDASISLRWLAEGRDTLPDRPIELGSDFTTQLLGPIVALAHRTDARNVANIGHGSGLSATALLTSDRLERLVNIEIEPRMVEGSLVFLPANAPAFSDPRSTYVFDDAKSYFSYRGERFDIVFAEPSNPWVSGSASLFTVEFYESVRDFISEGGVLAQWMQLYELTDELFLSVVAALDAVFPAYRAYLVGDSDVAIIATPAATLSEPDWSVLETPAFTGMTAGAPPFLREHMEGLLLFDETTLRPLLRSGARPNSDYRPMLDLGAERARFEQANADGVYSLGVSRLDLRRLLSERPSPLLTYRAVPAYGIRPAVLWGRSAWLREALARGGGVAPEAFPDWQGSITALQSFLQVVRGPDAPGSWVQWAVIFDNVEAELHWGAVGWVDEAFYAEVYDHLERTSAPPLARGAVDFKHALALFDWPRAATAADQLVTRVAAGERWMLPSTLLDGAVVAYIQVGRPTAALNALNLLGPLSGRAPGHLRNRLLAALIAEAR